MTRVELSRVRTLLVGPLEVTFASGVTTLIGSPALLGDIARIVAGYSLPKKGKARVEGKDPYRSPEVRRRTGSLFEREEPPEQPGPPLAAEETRRVALSAALEIVDPLVLALVEPLSAGLPRAEVVGRLRAHAARGAVVLSITASIRDAADLGGRTLVLENPRTLREASPAFAEAASHCEFVVRASDPQKLVAALAESSDVARIGWDERVATDIVVTGSNAERLSLAILRGAASNGVSIAALRSRRPGTGDVLNTGGSR